MQIKKYFRNKRYKRESVFFPTLDTKIVMIGYIQSVLKYFYATEKDEKKEQKEPNGEIKQSLHFDKTFNGNDKVDGEELSLIESMISNLQEMDENKVETVTSNPSTKDPSMNNDSKNEIDHQIGNTEISSIVEEVKSFEHEMGNLSSLQGNFILSLFINNRKRFTQKLEK